jgi:hypothetical protein
MRVGCHQSIMSLLSFILAAACKATAWNLALPVLYAFLELTKELHNREAYVFMLYLVSMVVTQTVTLLFWFFVIIDPRILHPNPDYIMNSWFQTHGIHTLPALFMLLSGWFMGYFNRGSIRQLSGVIDVLHLSYFVYIIMAHHLFFATYWWPYPMCDNLTWTGWILLFVFTRVLMSGIERIVAGLHNLYE